MRCSWIIKGVEHALNTKALFPGCQHGVGERVLLREAVKYLPCTPMVSTVLERFTVGVVET